MSLSALVACTTQIVWELAIFKGLQHYLNGHSVDTVSKAQLEHGAKSISQQ